MSYIRNRELSQFGSFVYITDDTKNIAITTTSTPYVGIGTTNPQRKLHVVGDIQIDGDLFYQGQLTLGNVDIQTTGIITAREFYNTLNQKLVAFDSWTQSGNNIYRVNGNIGIGTTNPQVKLDILGDIRSGQFISTVTGTRIFGTPPLSVQSQTLVANLNADFLRGGEPGGDINFGDIVTREHTQTLYNKTLISPNLSNPFLGNAIASSVKIGGATIKPPLAGISDIFLPSEGGTLLTSNTASVITGLVTTGNIQNGTILNEDISDNTIKNSKLENKTISNIPLGGTLNTLSFNGTYWNGGTSYNGSSGTVVTLAATPQNFGNYLVARDASGDFTAATITATNIIVSGTISANVYSLTNVNVTNVFASGITTTGRLDASTINGPIINGNQANFTGIVTTVNLNSVGISTIVNLNATNINSVGISTIVNLNATNINSVGISTIINLRSTNINSTGITTTFNLNTTNLNSTGISTVVNLNVTNLNSTGIATAINLNATNINVSGNGTVLIGSATSTGTLSQRLQVTGGAYVSGSVGIGTTNPSFSSYSYANDPYSKLSLLDGNVTIVGTGNQNGNYTIGPYVTVVGIGSTTSSSYLNGGDTYPNYSTVNYSNVNYSSGEFVFFKAGLTQTGTVGIATTCFSDTDSIGNLFARSYSGTQFENAAGLRFDLNSRNITGSGNHPSADIIFWGRNSNSVGQYNQTEWMRIRGNTGNVNIGITDSNAKLHVSGGLSGNDYDTKFFVTYGSATDGNSDTIDQYFSSNDVDSNGNILISGADGTNGIPFVLKLDPYGNKIWARYFTSTDPNKNYKVCESVAVNRTTNEIYTTILIDDVVDSIVLVKLDSSGNILWQRELDVASQYEWPGNVRVDSSGNVYVTGGTYNTTYTGNRCGIVIKLNSSGTIQWQKFIGQAGLNFYSYGLDIDSSLNVYVGSEGGSLGYVHKFNSSGTVLWQRSIGTTSGQCYDLKLDSSTNVYLCGYTNEQGAGGQDSYLIKLNTSGTLLWQRVIGDSGYNGSWHGLDVDASNNVYVGVEGGSTGSLHIFKYDLNGNLLIQKKFNGDQGYIASWWYWGHRQLTIYGNNLIWTGWSTINNEDGVLFKLPITLGSDVNGTYFNITNYDYNFGYYVSDSTDLTSSVSTLTISASSSTVGNSTLTNSAGALSFLADQNWSFVKSYNRNRGDNICFTNTAVSIGTTIPKADLDVSGKGLFSSIEVNNSAIFNSGMNVTGNTRITGNTYSDAYINRSDNNAYLGSNDLVLRGGAPTVTFRDTDNNTAYLHCNSNLLYVLRAGINANPGSWVQVSGQWPAYFNLTNNEAQFGSNVRAVGSFLAGSSDKRLKENLNVISNPLDKVKQLTGYTFDWKNEVNQLGFTPLISTNDIGLIAQDVEKVVPQAVSSAPFDQKWDGEKNVSSSGKNYLTVQYEKLVPLLVESIKEQQDIIDQQKLEIESLKNDIKVIKDSLNLNN